MWKNDKREWSTMKNIKQDNPNLVNTYIINKGIKLESSKRKRISISEILREIEDGKNENM